MFNNSTNLSPFMGISSMNAPTVPAKPTYSYPVRVCAYCGIQEGRHWYRHFQRYHPHCSKVEWKTGSALLDSPWCTNWQDVIDKMAAPEGVLEQFKVKARYGTASKGSTKSQSKGTTKVQVFEKEGQRHFVPVGGIGTCSKFENVVSQEEDSEEQTWSSCDTDMAEARF
jgi:hypothetical protein